MIRFVLFTILAAGLLFSYSQFQPGDNKRQLAEQFRKTESVFQTAERLSFRDDELSVDRSDSLFRISLKEFRKIAALAEKEQFDSLAFFSRLRLAYIEYYFDSTDEAKKDYHAVLDLHRRTAFLKDSFLFKPLLFTGSILQAENEFDSALYYYKQAEAIALRYPQPLEGSQRLYNRLGSFFYENGNYRQAGNYFQKAIAVLAITEPGNESLLVNYRINQGSLLVKLEEFGKAKKVFESILPYNILRNEIIHNLGIIEQKTGNHSGALRYLQQVQYGENKRNIDLYYNLALSYSAKGLKDSGSYYLNKALEENTRWNGSKPNIPHGLLLKFQADIMASNNLFEQAAATYQLAIQQFDPAFRPEQLFHNPVQFSAVFSYINLFNTLSAKADLLAAWYKQEKDLKMLEAAIDTYRTAFQLADHVEKTYNSDEARLFLNKLKWLVHSKPIDIALDLYSLTKRKNYLEDAYFFDQRNKASVLAFNIRENEWKEKTLEDDTLFQKESELRSSITRLSLMAVQTTDTNLLSAYQDQVREQEIALGHLQETIQKHKTGKTVNYGSSIPAIEWLQNQLDPATALISYHLSATGLVTLLVTKKKFDYLRVPVTEEFFLTIDSFKRYLEPGSSQQRYEGVQTSQRLYHTLLFPLEKKLSDINRLVIIPDDELHYLPFEALQDRNQHYLLERFTLQYQYSTALLTNHGNKSSSRGVLALAPFASQGYENKLDHSNFSRLPASGTEISKLEGKRLLDSMATKENFLREANHYKTLHLATHAAVNNEEPIRSYIAFYPRGDTEFRLYAGEIYGLKLDSTQMIILSACETGTGRLIKGEGLMSLSRAFAYAGCPNIITSLWKAEDKTTAFILQRLHHYLEKNYSPDIALQQAKMDFLFDPDTDPRFKSPSYWAPLILVGQYEPAPASRNWWWIAGTIVVLLTIVYFAKRKYGLSSFSS
jgi:CHAT domain-containing protein